MKTINAALVLAGCGVFDGSEIHEAVVAVLNLQRRGAEVSYFAPDVPQSCTVNHLTGECDSQNRSVLEESARIARGKISPLSAFSASNFDMLIFVGGFGAARNLCDFAEKGADCSVNPDASRAISDMLKLGRPTAFMCIAPVVAAKAIGGGVRLTIGNDAPIASALEKMGAKHIPCPADSFVCDSSRNVYSTPAYMLAKGTPEIDAGVGAMIDEMIKNIKK